MTKRALLVFTRSPEAEARAKGLVPERAAALFAAFLASWKRAAEATGSRLVISAPRRCSERIQAMGLSEGALFLVQSPGQFGERLASAVESAFDDGYSSVSVVAGDTPAISGTELDRVFVTIEQGDAPYVVGPACDGGVFLIGLPQAETNVLAKIALRNPRTCDALVSSLEGAGKKVSLLTPRGEVDSHADLQRLCRSSASSEVWGEYRPLLAAALETFVPLIPSAASIPTRFLRAAVPARAPPAA